MIDLNKEYQTEHGQKVKLMGMHDGFVVGLLMYTSITPSPMLWHLENGKCESNISLYDLVEVKQPIEHTVWVNVYEQGFSRYTHTTRESADEDAQEGVLDCIEVKYSSVK
jgi:hypothetical protein